MIRRDGVWVKQSHAEKIHYPEAIRNVLAKLEDNSFWFGHRNQVISMLVEKFEIKLPLFDIGGGNGSVSKHLEKNGASCVLVEPGENGILNAKAEGLTNLIHADFSDECFLDNALTSVGCFDVIEHIEDDKAFVRLLHKKLQTNGKLIVSVPAYELLWSEADVVAGHFRRYTRASLVELFLENGFSVLYSSYFFSFLWLPVFFFRAIAFRLSGKKEISLDKTEKELQQTERQKSKIIDWLRKVELCFVKRNKRIVFGTSCILVAQKKAENE